MGPRSQSEGVSCRQEGLGQARWTGTHSALEGIDLAGVGLDLVSVLHHLLLGLAQRVIVLVGCLGQVRHLRAERGPEVRRMQDAGRGGQGSMETQAHPPPHGRSHWKHFQTRLGARPLTLDLYHSSASEMFLAAMDSYWARMSLRAAVRSGLVMSISTWTCCSWSWACSSRISCRVGCV